MTTKILLGHAAVDSGQLLITDPCYLNKWQDNEYHPENEELADADGLRSYSYAGACSATIHTEIGGPLRFDSGNDGAGVVTSTGFGDGHYPVYAYVRDCGKRGKRVLRVEIEFEEEEED